MTLFSKGSFMICFRKEVYEGTRLFTRKLLAEMQDALGWERSHPRLPVLQRCALPAQSWSGAAAPALMTPTHSMCGSSHLCQGSLCYFCLLSRDILAQNHKEARQRGQEEPQHPQGTGASQQTGTHSSPPAESCFPCWASTPPPSHDKHKPVFLGFQRRLRMCTPIILEQAYSIT